MLGYFSKKTEAMCDLYTTFTAMDSNLALLGHVGSPILSSIKEKNADIDAQRI